TLTICSINAQKQFLGVEPLRFSLRFADRRSFRTISSFQLAELELKKAGKMPALQNPDKLLPIFSQLLSGLLARRLAGFVARSLLRALPSSLRASSICHHIYGKGH
ncbi:hypothetical protein L0156_00745, partial [bacterium]|nr:hypothetical protein [bacterium]